MRTLLVYLPGLVCLAMLLVVCGPMLLRRARGQACEQPSLSTAEELAELRDEVARLRSELAAGQAREATIDG